MARRGSAQRPKSTAARAEELDSPLRHALLSWVVPVAAGVVCGIALFLYAVGALSAPVAVTVIATFALAGILFYGLRSFLRDPTGPGVAGFIVVFAAFWAFAMWYPFYRSINPGTPVFTGELRRGGETLTVPMQANAGRFEVVVHGNFVPKEGRFAREGAYSIAVGHGKETDQMITGTLRQEWRSQRFGVGRRSSTVQVLKEHTERATEFLDADGHDLTLRLADLSPELSDKVMIKIYPAPPPSWVRIVLALASLAGALVVDAARVDDVENGLMSTLTVAVWVTLSLFSAFDTQEPSQLLVASLAGLIVGGTIGMLFTRLVPHLRSSLGWAEA